MSDDRYRFFVPDLAGEVVELPDDEAHHARHVLRLEAGCEVEVFDGRGGWAEGVLRLVGKHAAAVEIRRREVLARPRPVIELAFAVPKGKRLDWLLEKATELGAAKLTPVEFTRSVAVPELSEHARGRWLSACIAAAKQSGNNFLPEISPPRTLAELLCSTAAPAVQMGAQPRAAVPHEPFRLLGHAQAPNPLPAVLAGRDPDRPILALVGPEGGLTEQERQACLDGSFVPTAVGPYTLRVETAAIAMLAGIQACWLVR